MTEFPHIPTYITHIFALLSVIQKDIFFLGGGIHDRVSIQALLQDH